MKNSLNPETSKELKFRLLDLKRSILERMSILRVQMSELKHGGDEADESVALLSENQILSTVDRLRIQLHEIESALARLENGTYGICDITGEPIERERLLALPWTRLSIEGAELIEEKKRRYS